MQVLYEKDRSKWVEYDASLLNVLAAVGTSEELKISGLDRKYQWSVSLVGGKNHPLWGKNYGDADTPDEAKERAEQFVNDNLRP